MLFTAIFLLLFAGFMARNVVSHGNLFLENLQAQFKLERQTEIISLLLKEFQENASDWLWQTDAEGRPDLRPGAFRRGRANPLPLLRARQLFRRAGNALPGRCDHGLEHRRADEAARAASRDERSRRRRRRDHVIWSFTAKPNHDDDGQLLGHRGFGPDMTGTLAR